jgi:hypothetical protein
MNWLKTAIVGAIASLVMFLLIQVGLSSELAVVAALHEPFNVPPSAAFLISLGFDPQPLAAFLHFGYGIFWSLVLVAIYRSKTNAVRGIALSILLWLVMMAVYSPIIGWGFFGFGAVASDFAIDHPLHLGNPIKYMIMTLMVHIIYGALIGWLNALWTDFKEVPDTRKSE